MEKFCKSLRDHAIEIINFKKEQMKLLTKELQESHENAKIYYICQDKMWEKIYERYKIS